MALVVDDKPFVPGQRWVSKTEPELGMATVIKVEADQVGVLFPASGTTRTYSIEQSPLRRVLFRKGDSIRSHDGEEIIVEDVEESGGLVIYHGSGYQVPETDLSDFLSFDKPEDRLLGGHADAPVVFDRRFRALKFQHRVRQSPLRGFVGGRIELIPHQLFIAQEVTSRPLPRVLLADEVGLGKTIEACLVLHRLLVTRRVSRVLIVVPEPLINQWFVELLRKFNLQFRIAEEDRCQALESEASEGNPFLADQMVLASVAFLTQRERRGQQAVVAGWDLVVVDEAHHLEWAPQDTTPEYELVRALSSRTDGLLLLTATPEQMGATGHFARLRLLDPDRYYDLDAFLAETAQYREVARLADRLVGNLPIPARELKAMRRLLPKGAQRSGERWEAKDLEDPAIRRRLLTDLLDEHGTGRVMFRNTRAGMKNFPQRVANLTSIDCDDLDTHANWCAEFAKDTGNEPADAAQNYDYRKDPRIEWLMRFLRKYRTRKVLLICRTRAKVEAIESAIRDQINLNLAVFHEDLQLLQRDRNAAWFAEEDGARVLLCSEIGSEGRNFQFAHDLVLFDLPLNPELVEQRIGRLDRIGQKKDIQIHVPYLAGSAQEVLVRWYHEGLNAFEDHLECGHELRQEFTEELLSLAREFTSPSASSRRRIKSFLRRSRERRDALHQAYHEGRDHLLEIGSFDAGTAAAMVAEIRAEDQDVQLEEFLSETLDQLGIHLEALSDRRYLIGVGDLVKDAFPGIPPEGMAVTTRREHAVSREDIGFLTWDHPLIIGLFDAFLGSEQGNSCLAWQKDPELPLLCVEAVFLLEVVAPGLLHVDRFLPATPIRIVIDAQGQDRTEALTHHRLLQGAQGLPAYRLLDHPELTHSLIPSMLEEARAQADCQAITVIEQATQVMHRLYRHEISRLQHLSQVNPNVHPEEIREAESHMGQLADCMKNARLRLDSLCVVSSQEL